MEKKSLFHKICLFGHQTKLFSKEIRTLRVCVALKQFEAIVLTLIKLR